jgi:hypothetical protein
MWNWAETIIVAACITAFVVCGTFLLAWSGTW